MKLDQVTGNIRVLDLSNHRTKEPGSDINKRWVAGGHKTMELRCYFADFVLFRG